MVISIGILKKAFDSIQDTFIIYKKLLENMNGRKCL